MAPVFSRGQGLLSTEEIRKTTGDCCSLIKCLIDTTRYPVQSKEQMRCFVRGGDTEFNPEAQVRTGYRRTEKDVRTVGHASVTDRRLVTVGSSCQTFQSVISEHPGLQLGGPRISAQRVLQGVDECLWKVSGASLKSVPT